MKFIKKVIFGVNIVLALLLLASYLAPYTDPNQYPYFQILGVFYPVLLLSNILMVVLWMFVEFKKLFLSFIIIILGIIHLKGFINISNKGSVESGHLKVMSYNVGNSYHIKKGTDKEQKKTEFKQFLESKKNLDVLCLQECDYHSKKMLKEVFSDFHFHEYKKRGTLIVSRFPISNKGEIAFGTITNSCLWADVEYPKETVRVYTMHLQSNKVSKEANKVMEDVNLQEKSTWLGVKGILEKYSKFGKIRAKQAAKVKEHAAKTDLPVLICGDLNDPPTTYTYAELCGDFQDSFAEMGSGIGTTYAGSIPLLRIDYIFAENDFNVESFNTLDVPFSDHYPIIGSYSLD